MIAIPASAQVTAHLRRLHDIKGMSYSSIAKAAGINKTQISKHLRGESALHPRAAIKVMTVTGPVLQADSPTDETFVPACGTRRRIQGLLYMGWPHTEMYARSGVRTAVALSQRGDWVTIQTHLRIAKLYDELWDTPGPSNLSRAWARKLGYLPPLAWDDDTINDPDAWGDPGGEVGA